MILKDFIKKELKKECYTDEFVLSRHNAFKEIDSFELGSNLKIENIKKYLKWQEFSYRIFNIESFQKQDVIICDLKTAYIDHFAILKKYLNTLEKKDMYTCLNDIFFSNGLFVYVPPNKRITDFLRIILETKNAHIVDKIIIVLGENSELNYIELLENYNFKFRNNITQVFLEKSSKLNYFYYQNLSNKTDLISRKEAYVGDRASFQSFDLQLGSSSVDQSLSSFIKEGAKSDLYKIFISRGNQQYDLLMENNFEKSFSKGKIEVKGILKGQSKVSLNGIINIKKSCQKVEASFSEDALLLSPETNLKTIPALNIASSNVKASHRVAVTKFAEDELFYLKSRGISKKDAESLLIEGFFNKIIKNSKNELLEKMIFGAIRKKMIS